MGTGKTNTPLPSTPTLSPCESRDTGQRYPRGISRYTAKCAASRWSFTDPGFSTHDAGSDADGVVGYRYGVAFAGGTDVVWLG
jgi:hypothetical protein